MKELLRIGFENAYRGDQHLANEGRALSAATKFMEILRQTPFPNSPSRKEVEDPRIYDERLLVSLHDYLFGSWIPEKLRERSPFLQQRFDRVACQRLEAVLQNATREELTTIGEYR